MHVLKPRRIPPLSPKQFLIDRIPCKAVQKNQKYVPEFHVALATLFIYHAQASLHHPSLSLRKFPQSTIPKPELIDPTKTTNQQAMDPPKHPPTTLFQVYLRLRPPPSPLVQLTPQSLYPLLPAPERYLTVEPAPLTQDGMSTHITVHAPSESRKRAVEKFAFTKVFEESAEQIDIFRGAGVVEVVEGLLGEGRDGLVATLGVTGSGKVYRHAR